MIPGTETGYDFLLRPDEHVNGVKRRASAIRSLAKYMNAVGVPAYVIPVGALGRDKPFTPYIYSNSELESFFHAADQYPQSKWSPLKEHTVPILFRLMYGCGNPNVRIYFAIIMLREGR